MKPSAASATKSALRRELRRAVGNMSVEERAAASRRLCERLRRLALWEHAELVLFYHPLPDEPDLWPLALEKLGQGRSVALLGFRAEAGGYVPCEVRRLETDLRPGRYGVQEPGNHCPEVDTKRLDLTLVPGIGFTLGGDRLGRGKGHYDRILPRIPGFKCGVAFDCQLTSALPVEPHDTRLNGILTPTHWQSLAGQSSVVK